MGLLEKYGDKALTQTTQFSSAAFPSTAESETRGLSSGAGSDEPEQSTEEIADLLSSIVEGLDTLCTQLGNLDTVIKKHTADRTVPNPQGE
jgi:hypothetical protein